MNNDFEKNNLSESQSSNVYNVQSDGGRVKKGIPIAVIIVSMILLALIIGAFLIVGEMVATKKGYGGRGTVADKGNQEEVLEHVMYINGYEFELGVKLDDFLSGTGIKIDEEDLKKAKEKKELYGELDSSVTKDGKKANFKIYVDASDEEDITVQGIIVKPYLENYDLGVMEFKVLEKYDIEKALLSDFDKDIQRQVEKATIDDKEVYELKLHDSTGFGIKISFIKDGSVRNGYHIYYVDVLDTRVVD